jgi:hypothetical protein
VYLGVGSGVLEISKEFRTRLDVGIGVGVLEMRCGEDDSDSKYKLAALPTAYSKKVGTSLVPRYTKLLTLLLYC